MGISKRAKQVKESKGKADEQYLAGHPTRLEVANYVNALLEERYVPHVQGLIQMSSMVIQAILIKKGVCTGEELKEITEEFVKEQERRTKAMEGIKSGELLKEVMTDSYVKNLQAHVVKLKDISFQDSAIQQRYIDHMDKAASTLDSIVNKSEGIEDETREAILQDLMEDKRDIEHSEVKLNNADHKPILMGMLWDAIIPYAHKQLGQSKADGE